MFALHLFGIAVFIPLCHVNAVQDDISEKTVSDCIALYDVYAKSIWKEFSNVQ